jgi:SAM-dependent methyltransferase
MSELSKLDPTRRFTGRSRLYASFRPTYPDAAVAYVLKRCGLRENSLLIDVGCGTGISSRLFAARGLRVIGIDPNAEMLAEADAETAAKPEAARHGTGEPRVTYQAGHAEATGLPSSTADAVLAAQAFHWFKPDAALSEFHRLLKPEGWAILMWNERDERDPFAAAYGDIIRTARQAAAIEGQRQEGPGKALLASALFRNGECVNFGHEQPLDEEGLLGRAFSSSYAPTEADGVRRWEESIRALFRECQRAGSVILRYQTSVYLAERSG